MKCWPPDRRRPRCAATGRGLAAVLLSAAVGTTQEGEVLPVPATVARQVLAMGTLLDVCVTAAGASVAEAAGEAALQAVEAAEARLSTWRDDSELTRLNAAPVGQALAISAALHDELVAARRWCRATDGAFDPTIGGLLDAYDLRGAGRWPAAATLQAELDRSGFDGLELTSTTACRRRALRLDAGAFGKGAALAEAGRVALAAGATTARFDFGGQHFVAGAFAPAVVAVADPRDRERAGVSFVCGGRSVATSADGERLRQVDGRALGHLLDPRTGLPVGGRGSVTVVTDDPLAADCLSTALYVLGPERALAFAAAHDGIEALVLEPRGEQVVVRATAGLRDLVALHSDMQLR